MSSVAFLSALDYAAARDGYAFYSRDFLGVLREVLQHSESGLVEVVVSRRSGGGWPRLVRSAVSLLRRRSYFYADYGQPGCDVSRTLEAADMIVVNHYRALVILDKTGLLGSVRCPPVLYVAHNLESASLGSHSNGIRRRFFLKSMFLQTYSQFLAREERELLAQCQSVVTLTDEDRNRCIDMGVPPESVIVVPPLAIAPPVGEVKTRRDRIMLTLVGSFDWGVKRQNLYGFLRAVAATKRHFKVSLVGTGLTGLGLDKQFPSLEIHEGFDERYEILAITDAVIIPESQASGMKLKAVEAFAMKKVAVVHRSATEGLPNWIGQVWLVYDNDRQLRSILQTLTGDEINSRAADFDNRWDEWMQLFERKHMAKQIAAAVTRLDAAKTQRQQADV